MLVDVAPNSFHIDYKKVSEAITSKTKVIIPVDLGGVMCNYDRLYQVLEEKKSLYTPKNDIQSLFDRVIVLADSAHAIGATYKGKMAGEVADFTVFSLVVFKNKTRCQVSYTWLLLSKLIIIIKRDISYHIALKAT